MSDRIHLQPEAPPPSSLPRWLIALLIVAVGASALAGFVTMIEALLEEDDPCPAGTIAARADNGWVLCIPEREFGRCDPAVGCFPEGWTP